jgi:hypothetical protein
MHASFMLQSLSHLERKLWIEHIPNTGLLVFIVQLESNFLLLTCNILFPSLQSLSLIIVSYDHLFCPMPYHFISYKYILSSVVSLPHYGLFLIIYITHCLIGLTYIKNK